MLKTRISTRRLSFLPPVELRRPLLAGIGVFIGAWLFVSLLPAFAQWLYGDVRIYETWGSMMAGRLVPYRDFNIEYPPGALISFIAPVYLRKLFAYHGTYYFWFRVEILVIGVVALYAMAWGLAALGASRRRAFAALSLAGAGPALLGPVALARFDYWPALLAVAAIAALAGRRPLVACGFIAAGTAVKIFPIVLLPLALIELWRARGARGVAYGLAFTVAVLTAISGVLVAIAPHGFSWALHRQLHRPLQVESLGAAFFVVAHHVAGVHIHAVKRAGSDNLIGSGADLTASLLGVVTIVALLAVYTVYWRGARTRELLVAASVATVVAYIAFSKVFSPQYLVWLIPIVPLVGGRRGVRAGVLLVALLGLTQIWEPFRYFDYYRTWAPWLSSLVVLRDLLVVVLFAVLIRPSSDGDADEFDPMRAAVV
jgi:hypothetical protein